MSSNPTPLPAVTRKNHNKSKKGCLTCRKRRVKCNEIHPICKSCSRRREACVWNEDSYDPIAIVLPRVARLTLKVSTDHQLRLPVLSSFRPKELELLHNWTTNTIFTFIPDLPAIRYGFQVSLPQIAFQNEFLLHATFAVTSLHMHHLFPSSDHLLRAKMHCQRAVLGVLGASQNHVSSDAVLLANILLGTYWVAFPSWGSNNPDDLPDVFNWVPAARTFIRKIGFNRQDMLTGRISTPPFLPLAAIGNHTSSTLTPFPDILYRIYSPEMCPFDSEELEDKHVLAAYQVALELISHCTWSAFMDSRVQYLAIYAFLSIVPDIFIRLFLENRPRALILVAHYCAFLGQFDRVWWYSWERFQHDLMRIMSLLDERWLPCIEYPLDVLAMRDQRLSDAFDGLIYSKSPEEANN
ncbi:hypothetical protein DL96DRAFT_370609 [Flagelloscypha sp. PMI_526]|nr:hypothetical protein DL96DRAFT_370609 [Flagelloscypha sp. PMI_526]